MPVVHWINNKLKIYIYKKDHEPIHVHAIWGSGEKEAKINIHGCLIVASRGFKSKELRLISSYVKNNQTELMERWNEYQE